MKEAFFAGFKMFFDPIVFDPTVFELLGFVFAFLICGVGILVIIYLMTLALRRRR